MTNTARFYILGVSVAAIIALVVLLEAPSISNLKILIQDTRDSGKFASTEEAGQYGGWGKAGQELNLLDPTPVEGEGIKGIKHNYLFGFGQISGSNYGPFNSRRSNNLDGQNYWGNYGQEVDIALQAPLNPKPFTFRRNNKPATGARRPRNELIEAAEVEPVEAAEAAEVAEAEPLEAEVAAEPVPEVRPRSGRNTQPRNQFRNPYSTSRGSNTGRGWGGATSYCAINCGNDIANCRTLAEKQCNGNQICINGFRPRCEGVFNSCLRTCG